MDILKSRFTYQQLPERSSYISPFARNKNALKTLTGDCSSIARSDVHGGNHFRNSGPVANRFANKPKRPKESAA